MSVSLNIEQQKNGKTERSYYEVDFVANLGRKRYYVQSCLDVPDEEKLQQETRSYDKIDDSFKKIIVVNGTMKPRNTQKGYMIIGLKEFLLDDNSLDL